jgi:hypothetical protein
MRTTINLDHQLGGNTGEVSDINPDGMLAAEALSRPIPQAGPENGFGIRHAAAQLLREWARPLFSGTHRDTPSVIATQ